MLTRCPGCGKEIEETLDICPHCKRDFTIAVEGTGRRVGGAPKQPPLKPEAKKPADKPDPRTKKRPTPAPGADDMDDSVLPPHMRGEAVEKFDAAPSQIKSGPPLMYVGIAVVFIGGFAISRLTAKKEEPPPVVAEVVEIPKVEVEAVGEEAEEEKENKPVEIGFAPAVNTPTIENSDAPPINKPKKRRRRTAAIPKEAPPENIGPPKAPAPKHAKWRFRSNVINLVTLEPAADVSVTIFDLASGVRYPAGTTGSKGQFRKTVPSNLDGYKVLFQHNDYETKFLLGDAHPFADLSEDDRKAIAKKLKQFTKNIRPLIGNDDGKIIEKFYLLPREKHGMTLEEALDR